MAHRPYVFGPRSWHVAVAVDEHRILIHGGLSSEDAGQQTLDDTWIFDTRRLAFSQVRGVAQACGIALTAR
jgi:hypothetical protein